MKRLPERSRNEKETTACTATGGRVHPSLQEYLGFCLVRAAFRMRSRLEERLIEFELGPSQFGILTVLNSSGPLNQLSLGEELAIDKATMVKLIDGLERLKLVERSTCPDDRRAKFVTITTKGRKLWPKLLGIATEIETDFLAPLTKSEAKLLRTTLPKLIR